MIQPDSHLWTAFHELWTWARGCEGYDKKKWLELQREIENAIVPARDRRRGERRRKQ
jgi:hypothetical protein